MGLGSWVSDKVGLVEAKVDDKFLRKAMLQREIQMSLSIAFARDNLMWFGSLYGCFITGVSIAKLTGKSVPPVAGIPIIMGGFMLTNMADMAYGNKLERVVAEAEHIMDNERYRFIPPKQAPFEKLYRDEDKVGRSKEIYAVGNYWPSLFPIARSREE